MKEIGSEFWDVPFRINGGKRAFSKATQWFLSGRSALQAIAHELNDCHTVAMPAWCCDSMVKPFVDAGIAVHFYPVYLQKRRDQAVQSFVQDISLECDVLFLMDYFGYTSNFPDLAGYKGVVIRDVTHSFFSCAHFDADYYFGSLRKWCGVWTGGFAWRKDGKMLLVGASNADDCGYIALRERAMQLKREYIGGETTEGFKSYLCTFSEAEKLLENMGIVQAAVRDINVAQNLDIEFIRMRRRRNAAVLRKAFPELLIFREMMATDCPMFVPVLVPDGKREKLRHHLIKNEIYCPVHWPMSEYHTGEFNAGIHHRIDDRSAYLYENALSLVCDQRYTVEDMGRMVNVIKDLLMEAY